MPSPTPIRLLHLSDIHFRVDRRWDADPILRHLAGRIGDDVAAGLVPDLVVITGDLAFSGRAAEYALADEWLGRQLWPKLAAGQGTAPERDRLLLVPGNRDVDRAAVKRSARAVQADLLQSESPDAIAEVLSDEDERNALLKRHAAYLTFYGAWLGQDQPLPWWHRTLILHDQRLHIAGLDSAWMAQGDTDRGNLLLGRWQLNQTIDTAEAAGADWKLALLHHPWDYLAEFDAREAPRACRLHRDLILRGHLHDPETQRVLSPDPERNCLEIAAGCVYEHGGYPNAYQWIELHPKPRRVRVIHRLWVQGKWQPDRNQPGADQDGAVEIALALATAQPIRPQPPRAPDIPERYRSWLRQRHADLDLLGKGLRDGRAIRLGQVYVPALTRPPAPDPKAVTDAEPHRAAIDPERQAPTLLLGRIAHDSLYCPAAPGAGKTTFCRWVLLRALGLGADDQRPAPPDEYAEPEPTDLRRRLPVLVRLRDLWPGLAVAAGRRDGSRHDLERALAWWITQRERPDGLDPALLQAHLVQGSALLLLDGRQLPDDIYALYRRICDNVLHNRYLDETRERVPVKGRLEAIAYGMHSGEDLGEQRATPEARASAEEIERLLCGYANLVGDHEQARISPAEWREDLLTRSGLLLPQADGGAAFYHLSIQEFLAAERIAHRRLDDAALEQVFLARWQQPEWRLTLKFLFAGEAFHARIGTGGPWRQGLLQRLAADLRREQVKANPAPAVFVAEALELCIAKGDRPSPTLAERMRRVARDAIEDEIPVKARHGLGLCLGRLGDPRIKDLRDPAAYVQVPPGDYVYGDDNQPLRIDTPFLLSRYPVTNSQYAAFIDAGGYRERGYWSDQGWAWREAEGVTEPDNWRDKVYNNPSQPVVGVSFHEAEACCRWAGGRPPTEQEWEAAARGPGGCEYPWCGDWEDGICNSVEAGLGGTSTVGLFPRSDQRQLGIADMAGNVWEWCDSFYERTGEGGGGVSRVLRGGAFYLSSVNLRCASRFRYLPEFRDGGSSCSCRSG